MAAERTNEAIMVKGREIIITKVSNDGYFYFELPEKEKAKILKITCDLIKEGF